MEHKVEIKHMEWLTHDVMQLTVEKPKDFKYEPGQAIEATLDDPDFKEMWSPFTMTSLPRDKFLQFTIKNYSEHNGLTVNLSKLKVGDSFLITDPFDTFKNNGAGVFIAGGTGVTPFIALLRQMYVDGDVEGSTLIFSNKTEKDIFHFDEFSRIMGEKNFLNVLTREKKEPYLHGRVDKNFLQEHIHNFNQPFYLCGPDNFSEDIKGYLEELGAGEDLVNLSL